MQRDCVSVAAADVKLIVASGFTVIVPLKGFCTQVPVVVPVKLNGEPVVVVGEPLIVNVPFAKVPVTPAGSPLTVAPVPPPAME